MGDDSLGSGPPGERGREPSVVVNVPGFGSTSSQREVLASEDALMRHSSFRAGAIIADKYIVERVIGEGGLGVVVAARHQHLDQTVAIKYLRPKVLGSKAVTERFLREARLAAKIRSEHVVRVYDVGTLPEGTPYMVMEYLAGTDLGQVLSANGPLPVERAVDYVLQACEALAEAHVAGIVHRDLKPDNLFLAAGAAGKSHVKVLDFGISKISSKRSDSGRVSELTEANDQFGTPVYMSPEQLRSSADVDARADVWAIGVILYELLTGRLPFEGEGLPELCTAIISLPPVPLTTARPYLPASMQTVIERCLEKDREARFQNVAELAQELRSYATPTGQESIAHIVRVIREAGETVRPATPVPTESNARMMREALTLAPSAEGRKALTTSTGAASWGATSTHTATSGWKRWRFALIGVAAVSVALVAGLTRLHEPSADGPPKPAASAATNDTVRTAPLEAPATLVQPAPRSDATEPAAAGSLAALARARRLPAPARRPWWFPPPRLPACALERCARPPARRRSRPRHREGSRRHPPRRLRPVRSTPTPSSIPSSEMSLRAPPRAVDLTAGPRCSAHARRARAG